MDRTWQHSELPVFQWKHWLINQKSIILDYYWMSETLVNYFLCFSDQDGEKLQPMANCVSKNLENAMPHQSNEQTINKQRKVISIVNLSRMTLNNCQMGQFCQQRFCFRMKAWRMLHTKKLHPNNLKLLTSRSWTFNCTTNFWINNGHAWLSYPHQKQHIFINHTQSTTMTLVYLRTWSMWTTQQLYVRPDSSQFFSFRVQKFF